MQDLQWKEQNMKNLRIVKIKLSSLSSPSKGKKKINWSTINVYGPEEIRVYRATSKTGTYSLIKTITDGTATTYTDSGLTAGKHTIIR